MRDHNILSDSDSGDEIDQYHALIVEDDNDFIGGSTVVSRKTTLNIERSETAHDDDVDHSTHKIFTFSLPFGKKVIPIISDIKSVLPRSPFNATSMEKQRVRDKLKRQESIDSNEERLLFQDIKGIDNSRLRAIKSFLTPNFLNDNILQSKPEFTEDGYSVERLSSVWNELEGDIVIMGGYRGSVLRDSHTHKRIWIPIKAGLNIRKINMRLGPADDDELHATDDIYPSGMLTHIGPIDISKRLIRKLRNNPKVRVHEFGYDWRLSLDIVSQQLEEFMKTLKKPYVIAHSMGGLVSHHVLQRNPDIFRGLIYVGSPGSCPNILGPFRYGDSVILNSSILSAEATFFMRSSFYFLPLNGQCFASDNERYDLDFFNPLTWYEYNLSPVVASTRTKDVQSPTKTGFLSSEEESLVTPVDQSMAYLSRTLARAKRFLEGLDFNPEINYPPLAMVYGNKVPTVKNSRVSGPQDIFDGVYDDFYYGLGDGVVYQKWLLPECRGFPVVAKIASDRGHVSLMTDFDAMAKAFISLIDAQRE